MLVAKPGAIDDDIFGRSVVFVLDHCGDEGTFGLVLNKPISLSSSSEAPASRTAFAASSDTKRRAMIASPLYTGGPLDLDVVQVLHSIPGVPGSSTIIPGVYTASLEAVIDVARRGGLATDHGYKFLAGYAGWGPGQLDDEIAAGVWTVSATSTSYVMSALGAQGDVLWEQLNSALGVDIPPT
jgi:putative transcriptional regulator